MAHITARSHGALHTPPRATQAKGGVFWNIPREAQMEGLCLSEPGSSTRPLVLPRGEGIRLASPFFPGTNWKGSESSFRVARNYTLAPKPHVTQR